MTLAEEAQRYLAVVEFFRAQGCEPHWQPEDTPSPVLPPVKTWEGALYEKSRGA